jgi:succinate-semialdehyde dehydrogenase / glutarate-semialdehyde dehydrogenase
MNPHYPDTSLYIDGAWSGAAEGATLAVHNPADGREIGRVAHAGRADLDRALAAAERGFRLWRKTSAFDRAVVLRRAADLMRQRADAIAPFMTLEQGKPLKEAAMEASAAAGIIDWFAEEARRGYGRVIPARAEGVTQLSLREPVGPVAAFTPWNFPINQAVRKIAAALAAGCSIVLKGPEETPASCAELVRVFHDAGVPAGVLNLVFGTPSEISSYLIPSPVVRKVTFTGSTPVGKQLAALAGQHMKRITMELGGHAPVLVFDDADIATAAKLIATVKFRNAGQVCVAPTRLLVHENVYEPFLQAFAEVTRAIRVGDGLAAETTMGPLANARRLDAMQVLVADAVAQGARVRTGGERVGPRGNFFAPTILTDVPLSTQAMNVEPFGPLAAVSPFRDADAAFAEANRLPYGLAAYVFTRSIRNASRAASEIESGMITINHLGLALPEVPFGGVKDSGYGSEGGTEAMDAYYNIKFVTQAGA